MDEAKESEEREASAAVARRAVARVIPRKARTPVTKRAGE